MNHTHVKNTLHNSTRLKLHVLYHSHLGEVDKVVFSVVGCSLLNEGQVSQVHSQVGDTWGVTAEDTRQVRSQLTQKVFKKSKKLVYLLLQSFSQVFESAF